MQPSNSKLCFRRFSSSGLGLFMEPSQLTSLSIPQLISLLLTLVCEITRRLHTPIELGATIGETQDVNIDMQPAETHASTHPWQTSSTTAATSSTTMPGTPTGPAAETQCMYICGMADCDHLCAAQGDHGYHRCDLHWWN